jgi:hypothetical protein
MSSMQAAQSKAPHQEAEQIFLRFYKAAIIESPVS